MCGSRQRVTAITEVGAATTATCKGRSTGDRQRRPLVQRGAAALAPAAVAYVSKRVHRAAHKHRRKGALREVGPPTPRPSLVARERHVAGDAERALKEAEAAAPVGAAPGGGGGAVDIDGRAEHREEAAAVAGSLILLEGQGRRRRRRERRRVQLRPAAVKLCGVACAPRAAEPAGRSAVTHDAGASAGPRDAA